MAQRVQGRNSTDNTREHQAKAPKVPPFVERRDD